MFVTDADGTIMGRRPEFDQYIAFRARIQALRARYGAKWVVCTGRSLRGYSRIFRAMNRFGITPDYVITKPAYLYECRRWGFLPHWIWNFRILKMQWRETLKVRRVLPRLRRLVLNRNPFARVAYSSRQRLCFRFQDEGAEKFGAEILREEVRAYPFLQLFQSPGVLDIRVIPFTKGLTVTELARHLGISNDRILVVGDGHNDVSMLSLQPPCLAGCPSNAASDVLETVHRAKGHIASEASLNGVMEILDAYESGQVNSALPEDWVGYDRPGHSPRIPVRRKNRLVSFFMLAMALYVTLLVTCYFCRVPGREMILKPYCILVEMVTGKPMGACWPAGATKTTTTVTRKK